MPQSALIARDAANCNNDDSDESEHSQALECDTIDHEHPRNNNDSCIKQVEAIDQELSTAGKRLQNDLNEEDSQEDEVDIVEQVCIDLKKVAHRQVKQDENTVQTDRQK